MLRTTRPVESLVNFDTEKAPRDMNGISYCFLIQHLQGEGEAGRVLCEILLDSLDYWYVNSSTTFFFLIFTFWSHHTTCWILVPPPGIEPAPPTLELLSLNHWTPREVPSSNYFSAN